MLRVWSRASNQYLGFFLGVNSQGLLMVVIPAGTIITIRPEDAKVEYPVGLDDRNWKASERT